MALSLWDAASSLSADITTTAEASAYALQGARLSWWPATDAGTRAAALVEDLAWTAALATRTTLGFGVGDEQNYNQHGEDHVTGLHFGVCAAWTNSQEQDLFCIQFIPSCRDVEVSVHAPLMFYVFQGVRAWFPLFV